MEVDKGCDVGGIDHVIKIFPAIGDRQGKSRNRTSNRN